LLITIVIAFLAVIGIASFLLGTVKKSYKDYSGKDISIRTPSFIVGGVAMGLSLLMLFFASFTIVQATEVGVPVAFGHVGKPLDNGVHFVAPWVSVDSYPIRPITVQLTGDQKVIARTADAGQMSVEIAARWRVEKQDASKLYYQSRTGDLGSISDNIVLPNLRQAVGQIYSVTGNLDAISNRDKVAEDIRVQLNKQLVPYGILVDTVSMRSVEPDNSTAATISQFASQQQATRIATEAKKTAEIEAQRRLIEAQGLKSAASATAGMTAAEMQTVCMQVWQQTVQAGINKGIAIYTNPCSSSSPTVIAK
jgi:hypothetical protein